MSYGIVDDSVVEVGVVVLLVDAVDLSNVLTILDCIRLEHGKVFEGVVQTDETVEWG